LLGGWTGSGVETNQIFDSFDSQMEDKMKDRQQMDRQQMDRQQKRESSMHGGRHIMVQVYSYHIRGSVDCASIISVLFEDVFENGI
jgi:hypothetical protein